MQEIIAFSLVSLAAFYLIYKAYKHFYTKKSSCEGCSFSPNNGSK